MAASTPPSTTIHELEAFCPGCPEPGEVTAFLDTQGFTLGFTMGAVPAHDRNIAPLPAQFHYERDDVMYNPKSTPLILFSSSGLRVTASTTVSALCLAPPSLRI